MGKISRISTIEAVHSNVKSARSNLSAQEDILCQEVRKFLEAEESSLRDMAAKMDVSVAYLSDIRHGRRKVSDAIVQKLRGLK